MSAVTCGYGAASGISVINLLLTPYNLQLLSPTTRMDAFATLTTISAMVFAIIAVIFLVASVDAHVIIVMERAADRCYSIFRKYCFSGDSDILQRGV